MHGRGQGNGKYGLIWMIAFEVLSCCAFILVSTSRALLFICGIDSDSILDSGPISREPMCSPVSRLVSVWHTEIQHFVGDGGLHSSGGWVPDRRQAASAVSIGHHLLRQLPASFPAKSRACCFPHRWPKARFT